MTQKTTSSQRLRMTQISWRPMLEAIPRRNAAADVQQEADGTLRIRVALQRPKWLVPPISWVIQPAAHRNVVLDPLVAEIWSHCDGRSTVERIIEDFAEQYRLSFHESRVAVTERLKAMVQRGILAIEQPI